jgi:hypothetical protein
VNKTNKALVLAHRKGYRVTGEGEVVNAVGRERKCQRKKSGKDLRLVFNISVGGRNKMPVSVHKLQAYQMFGEEMFAEGMVVRHLDGNPLNNIPENIAVGTVRDNIMDRDPEERKAHALKAAAGRTNLREDWDLIETDHRDNNMGFKLLSRKYGVSIGALSFHFRKMEGWKPIQQYNFDWNAVRDFVLETKCSYFDAALHFKCSDKSIRRRLGKRRDLKQFACNLTESGH